MSPRDDIEVTFDVAITSGTSDFLDQDIYEERAVIDGLWEVDFYDGTDPEDEPEIFNVTLCRASAYRPVVVNLPADDIDANVARLVALLNEHWPITEDAATWFERCHQDAIAEDQLHDTIKADLGQEE